MRNAFDAATPGSLVLPRIGDLQELSDLADCTGGIQLSVFELVTAQYAADGFNLRRDWYGEGQEKGRHAKLAAKPLLKDTAATEFLQGISLLHTYERQLQDLNDGKSGKAVTPVSAKREHILSMPLSAYKKWADKLTSGFFETDQFLRHLGFHDPKFLPYRAQVIPLAATLALIGDRWLEPQVQDNVNHNSQSGIAVAIPHSAKIVDIQYWCKEGV